MITLHWIDENGYYHLSLVRNEDDNPLWGIPLEPPSLAELGISIELQKDLHNELVRRNLFSWSDVQAQQNSVTGAVKAVARHHKIDNVRQLVRAVISLYRR